MQIAGIQRLTLLDYPGHTACTVFTAGCNFRCGYCHNPEMVLPDKIAALKNSLIPEEALYNFLEARVGLLDGVCITGGEPTLQGDLLAVLQKIRDKGFKVKLDTNGSNPGVLRECLEKNLVQYVAMDIKASPERYAQAAGTRVMVENIAESRDMLMGSGIDYEFRTTVLPWLHDMDEFGALLASIRGAKRYFLQNFRGAQGCLDEGLAERRGFSDEELVGMLEMARGVVEYAELRV